MAWADARVVAADVPVATPDARAKPTAVVAMNFPARLRRLAGLDLFIVSSFARDAVICQSGRCA
jgi:hypothetical protein